MADYKDKAKKIVKRRQKSMDYWAPIYDEFAEVQQAIQCRTSPIYKKDKNGQDTSEIDETRTNVCMPGLSILTRKNAARMTANPPQLEYISRNKAVAEKLTGWSYMQYDLANEEPVRRRTVMQGEAFGFAVEKTFQDDVEPRTFRYRVRTKDATYGQLAKYRGAEVEGEDRALTADELAQAIAEIGPEFTLTEQVKKYSGPVQKSIFVGDFHMPPGCSSLDEADWLIEEYVVDETWFEYWLPKTFTDEDRESETYGEEIPVMYQEAVDEMVDEDRDIPDDEKQSLRQRFRDLVNLDTTHQYDKEISCSKKFKIYECHYKKDGKNWICWVGNETHYLGEMPYPWDLYGKWQYTALTPLPNLVSAIGDSTPRLGRFLHRLHNVNTGQRQDIITNFMKLKVFMREGTDIPEEALNVSNLQIYTVRNPNDIKTEQMPQIPQWVWEQEAALLRQLYLLDPALASADMAGTNANPGAGKTATVGVLAQRERDVLLDLKVKALTAFIREIAQKKLWILQQTLQEPAKIAGKYFNEGTLKGLLGIPADAPPEAISMRYGNAAVVELDPFEFQEDIQVEPKAGSTLSIEDEFHRMGWQTLFQAAQSAPEVFDIHYVAKGWAGTIPGVDGGKAVKPPAPPPDPLTLMKHSASYNYPMDKMAVLAPNLFTQLLERQGFEPDPEVGHNATLEGVKKIGEAADAVGKLAEPAVAQRAGGGGEEGIRRTAADNI